jgi:hypothetical protein
MGNEAFELSEEANDLKDSGDNQHEVVHYPNQFMRQYGHLIYFELILDNRAFKP